MQKDKESELEMLVQEYEGKKQEVSKKIVMPDFVPQLDKTKEIEDQAADVIKVMGAQKASQNEEFMTKVSENFSKGILTEQETKQMRNEMMKAEQYFIKWQKVLELAYVHEAQGLGLMQILVFTMIIPYLLLRGIGFIFMVISETFNFFNTLFNSVFGDGGKFILDREGRPVINEKTKKPYRQNTGYNLFAKILLGFIIGAVLIALIFLFINMFTGFDVFVWLRNAVGS